MRGIESRTHMVQVLENYTQQCRELRPGTINAGMSPELSGCDPDAGWVELKYPVAEWMRNLRGSVHGGAVCAMFDNAMGALAWCVAGGRPCPTITLQTSFVRPLTVGTIVHVRASLTSGGRTLSYTEAKLWMEGEEDRVLATATGVYHTGGV